MVWKKLPAKKSMSLSRLEIVLYFSQKKQETGGTTLDLSVLLSDTKQLGERRKESKLSVKLNVKVKYFPHQLQYWLSSSHSGCQCNVKTKKHKNTFPIGANTGKDSRYKI